MVINSYMILPVGSTCKGGIIFETIDHPIQSRFVVTRVITQQEYLAALADSIYAWAVPLFQPHPDLKFYEVEHLPD